MKKLAFFDTKSYDRECFDKLKNTYNVYFEYFESNLNYKTAVLATGFDGVVAFVNDNIDAKTIDILYQNNIRLLALRCAGYNNVDLKHAYNKIHVLRVPAYSPHAVAEHAMALLLCLNRKIHIANSRTRDFNFSLNGLTGFDLYDKTIGVVGTGKIGKCFIDICNGFGMKVLAYDPYPQKDLSARYVDLEYLFTNSDIISLHCPLTKDSYHIVDKKSLDICKPNVYIINTSRGALIDSGALLNSLKNKKIAGAGLDVYEEESEIFYEDFSTEIIQDDVLARLLTMPNVLITSHQAFLTKEALGNIAKVTLENIRAFFDRKQLVNEVCYKCSK